MELQPSDLVFVLLWLAPPVGAGIEYRSRPALTPFFGDAHAVCI